MLCFFPNCTQNPIQPPPNASKNLSQKERQKQLISRLRDGSYIGFWVQFGKKHNIRMNLRFDTPKIAGDGVDEVAPFEIIGQIYSNCSFQMVQKYKGGHSQEYRGTIIEADNGLPILQGTWEIGPPLEVAKDEFCLWPDDGQPCPVVPSGVRVDHETGIAAQQQPRMYQNAHHA